MKRSFNYSGFIDMFLNSDDEFEPYGCVDTTPQAANNQRKQPAQVQHYESLITDPGED